MPRASLRLPKGMREEAGRLYYRIFRDGKRFEGALGFEAKRSNLDQATARLSEIRRLVEGGEESLLRLEAVPFNSGAQLYLEWKKGQSQKVSTYERIRTSCASLLAFFGTTPVHLIRDGEVDSYIAWRRKNGIKSVTLANDMGALRSFFDYARRQRWTRVNPVASPDFKRPSRKDAVREVILSEADEVIYLAAAESHRDLYDAARLLLGTGMRPNKEMFSLQWSAVDFANNEIHVVDSKTKTGVRDIPMTPEVRQLLLDRREAANAAVLRRRQAIDEWKEKRASKTREIRLREHMQGLEAELTFVFPSRRGGHLQDLYEAHNKALNACGLSFVLYSLRHTFASRFANGDRRSNYQSYGQLPVLMKLLGHTDPRVTMKYVKTSKEAVRAAMDRYGTIGSFLAVPPPVEGPGNGPEWPTLATRKG